MTLLLNKPCAGLPTKREAIFLKTMLSDKPIKPLSQVLGKRAYIFDKEYANDFDPKGEVKGAGMVVDINGNTHFIKCGEPVELTYEVWAALKNIGRIGRIVTVKNDEQSA